MIESQGRNFSIGVFASLTCQKKKTKKGKVKINSCAYHREEVKARLAYLIELVVIMLDCVKTAHHSSLVICSFFSNFTSDFYLIF